MPLIEDQSLPMNQTLTTNSLRDRVLFSNLNHIALFFVALGFDAFLWLQIVECIMFITGLIYSKILSFNPKAVYRKLIKPQTI